MSKPLRSIEELIDIGLLCNILKFKKSYVYLLTHEKKIPHYKIQGHLRFRLSEIEDWLAKKSISAKDFYKIIDF